jgi:hypothetical protein
MPLLYTLTKWDSNTEISEDLPGLLAEQIAILVKNLSPNSFFVCYFPMLLSYYCWCEYVPIITLFYDIYYFHIWNWDMWIMKYWART